MINSKSLRYYNVKIKKKKNLPSVPKGFNCKGIQILHW